MPPKDREIDYSNSDQLADAFLISPRPAVNFTKYHKVSAFTLLDAVKKFFHKEKINFEDNKKAINKIMTLEKQLSEVNESNRRLMERATELNKHIEMLQKTISSANTELVKSDQDAEKYEQDISFLRRIIEKLIR
jgi:septal ring factor EnvC (AmiA/AmiB activator)